MAHVTGFITRYSWKDIVQTLTSTGAQVLAIFFTTIWVFRSAGQGFFSQDDFVFLARSSQVRAWQDFWTMFATPDYFYRPIPRVAILTSEWFLFGLDPQDYHRAHLALHVVNVMLLYLLCWRVTHHNRKIAFIAALFYGSHPAHYLAVYWIAVVQEIALALFLLLSANAYVLYQTKSNRWNYFLSLVFFVCALLSKEMAAVFPFIILLLDLLLGKEPLGLLSTYVRAVKRALPFGFLLLVYFLMRLQQGFLITDTGPYAWRWELGVVLRNLHVYTLDTLVMRDWAFNNPSRGWLVILGVFVVIGLFFLRARRYRVQIALGVGWFLTSLIPLVLMANHDYSYYLNLPLMGVALVIGTLINVVDESIRGRMGNKGLRRAVSSAAIFIVMTVAWAYICNVRVQTLEVQDPAGILSKGRIAQRAVQEVMSQYPDLPEGGTLYIKGATERDMWAVGFGGAFELFYGKKLNVLFDFRTPLNEEQLTQVEACIYEFWTEE